MSSPITGLRYEEKQIGSTFKSSKVEYIWEKADEIGKLQGAIVQELRTGIMRKQFKDISGDVACQLLLLIKNNYQEVLKHINDMEQ